MLDLRLDVAETRRRRGITCSSATISGASRRVATHVNRWRRGAREGGNARLRRARRPPGELFDGPPRKAGSPPSELSYLERVLNAVVFRGAARAGDESLKSPLGLAPSRGAAIFLRTSSPSRWPSSVERAREEIENVSSRAGSPGSKLQLREARGSTSWFPPIEKSSADCFEYFIGPVIGADARST